MKPILEVGPADEDGQKENTMKRRFLSILAMSAAWSTSQAAFSPWERILETLMHVDNSAGTFIGITTNLTELTVIEFNHSIDLTTMTFSWSTTSGQTMSGKPFSLNATGTFDEQTLLSTWNGSYSVGTDLGSFEGTAQWQLVQRDDEQEKAKIDQRVTWRTNKYLATGELSIYKGKDGSISTGSLNFTPESGSDTITLNASDRLVNGVWTVTSYAEPLKRYSNRSSGSTGYPDGSSGNHSWAVVPEPDSGLVALFGLVGLSGIRSRARLRANRRT